MKMYCLNPNSYGEIAFVMSDSKENALKIIINAMKEDDIKYNCTSYLYFYNATIDNLPYDFTLCEYDKNKVYIGEIA